jgi:DNA-binding IscR family transcriptional regulator
VGEVIRFVQGPIGPVNCVETPSEEKCPLYGACVFLPMWERAHEAMAQVYDGTTFAELVDEDSRSDREHVPSYSI